MAGEGGIENSTVVDPVALGVQRGPRKTVDSNVHFSYEKVTDIDTLIKVQV